MKISKLDNGKVTPTLQMYGSVTFCTHPLVRRYLHDMRYLSKFDQHGIDRYITSKYGIDASYSYDNNGIRSLTCYFDTDQDAVAFMLSYDMSPT